MSATDATAVPEDLVAVVNGVLLPGFTGTQPPAWLEDAAAHGLAGVVWFAHNTPDVATAARLGARLHEVAPDLLVTVDEEGGDVSRLEAATGSSLPGAAALGMVDDVDLTREVGQALGALLAAVGVDLDLAPCLDVNSDPYNPVIGVRSFGATPDLVTRHAAAFTVGLHAGGVGACVKHFPGHGATTVDSHLALPVVDADEDTLRVRDLSPFVEVLAGGVEAVMTAHVVVPALGPEPATLEPAVTRLVRELGHEGPIVTDALDMGAVSGAEGIGAVAVRALEAGADLLCLGTTRDRDDEKLYRQAFDAVADALRVGRLSVERLRESARRTVRAARAASALRAASGVVAGPDQALAAQDRLSQLGARVARAAVRFEASGTLEVPLSGDPILVDLRARYDHAAGRTARHLETAVRGRWPETTVVGSEDLALGLVSDGNRPVLVVTREPFPDGSEHAALVELSSVRPDLVVLHTGVPASAAHLHALSGGMPAVLLACGTGRANAHAVVELLSGAVHPQAAVR